MIDRLFAEQTWLWPTVWQSTTILAIGLGASLILRKRAVRAHLCLLLASAAAIVVPLLTTLVAQHQWGLLKAKSISVTAENRPLVILDKPNPTVPRHGIEAESTTTLVPTKPPIESRQVPSTVAWSTRVIPLWIVLSAALLVRLTIRFLLGYRLARRSVACQIPELAEPIERAKAKLSLSSDIQVRRSADTHSPVIWCWGTKPILLVPAEINDDIDWESVVCHELAHWKRRDHLSGLWAELIVCLLPWHPLSWLAQRHLVRLSEEACDDWVIAAGQIGTRYARTLLGLTPQGRAALVPAVVSSKKGLATRIRRILADRCANPQAGRRWSLAAALLVGTLTAGIAFAQTRPARPTGMITTTLDHGAVIEQLASTATIEGVVLDLDGSPVGDARIIALPMTVYGREVDGSDQGRFKVLWSPAWLEKDQHLYLVARGPGQERQAAFVEVTDLTSPVTIQLEPAFALEATVVDAEGRRIQSYSASLSLTRQFKCQAPIWATDVGAPRVRLFSPVPFGLKYRLRIEAEGYQTRQVMVDGTDRSRGVIDLGEIVLEPQDVAHPVAPIATSHADLQKAFLELYRLDEGETIKLIKPPFLLGRQEWLLTQSKVLDFALEIGGGYNLGFQWDDELKLRAGATGRSMELQTVLRLMLGIPRRDFNLPEKLNLRLPAADWIVRHDASAQTRLRGLETIVATELHRAIRFEKHTVERDTIIVTGEYNFTPLPGKDTDRLCIFADKQARLIRAEADSLADLWRSVADGINIAIDDRSSSAPTGPIRYAYGDVIYPPRKEPLDKERDLPALLDNLAKQTGLTFTVEKRPTDVWFISEPPSEPAVATDQP